MGTLADFVVGKSNATRRNRFLNIVPTVKLPRSRQFSHINLIYSSLLLGSGKKLKKIRRFVFKNNYPEISLENESLLVLCITVITSRK